MSVVFHRSAGKMIFKSFVIAIVLSFAWIKSVAGATSYSNVYMQSGPLTTFYGPAALRSAQLAPLAASPLMSSLIPPCVSPCVLPNQQVAALAPVATSRSNFVSYKPPITVPVVIAPANDEPTSYEYSYVVYDEDTGDQKAQKESSDGSVVRGEYSLIQPDGYVREVQYTADDLRGFNAVVKNFLPEAEAKNLPPCPENKNEPIKESPKGESQQKANEAQDLEPEVHAEEHGNKDTVEPKHEEHGEVTETEKHEEPVEPAKTEEHKEQNGGNEEHKQPEGHEEHGESKQSEEHGKPEEQEIQGKEEEHASPEVHGEPEKQEESHAAEEHGSEEKKKEEPRAASGADVQVEDLNPLVSYNDIIKCIQSAIKGMNTAQPSASPLTYIILNKPC